MDEFCGCSSVAEKMRIQHAARGKVGGRMESTTHWITFQQGVATRSFRQLMLVLAARTPSALFLWVNQQQAWEVDGAAFFSKPLFQ
jgi:hypothetical protein